MVYSANFLNNLLLKYHIEQELTYYIGSTDFAYAQTDPIRIEIVMGMHQIVLLCIDVVAVFFIITPLISIHSNR